MYYYYNFGVFNFIIMVLFWIAIVWLIVWAIRGGHPRRHWRDWHDYGPHNLQTPLDILKERYAKGEITKEQFDQMKKDLER